MTLLGLPSFTKIACNNEPRLMTVQCSYRFKLAEKEGFEPSLGLHLLAVFETAPFGHLGTSP